MIPSEKGWPWYVFKCPGSGCEIDTDDDDEIQLTKPQILNLPGESVCVFVVEHLFVISGWKQMGKMASGENFIRN